MACYEPDKHRRAFEASYVTVFIYDDERLVGIGRAISDGEYEAAVYDIAVLPGYQGRGLGRLLMEQISDKLSHCNLILFARPGKESFYAKQRFCRMKTGMACFKDSATMRELGFIE
jgi:GNAT superfamily N-acetyltransferase